MQSKNKKQTNEADENRHSTNHKSLSESLRDERVIISLKETKKEIEEKIISWIKN